MALSALFLIVFLLQHMSINLLSVISPDLFNEVSQFMGTNPLVQGLLQPILIIGVIFHFVMGFILEAKNRSSREVSYAMYKGAANASWMSRNMLWTGLAILCFMGLHFYDFWVHEITVKYIQGDMTGLDAAGNFRYHEELVAKFVDIWRVSIYVLSFIFLGLHLQHGFASAWQSIGLRNKGYASTITKLGNVYAVAVPLGFIFIALFHHFNH
jgi:succinate dehydrogenase / fumarate reductase cytochrome b subunit